MSTQDTAALIESVNKMTDTVAGKMGEIDQHLEESSEQINEQLNQVKFMLPRIVITRNQSLIIDPETGFPKNFSLHSNVSASLYMAISGSPSARTEEQNAILQEIEVDAGASMRKAHHYRSGFNIVKLSWETSDGSYLGFPQASDDPGLVSVPLNTYFTIGAFVKILSGSVGGSWASGAELGKWKFCSQKFGPAGFGQYTHLHPYRGASSGEVLIALPAAITGHIDHPNNWFPNIILGV